MTAILMSSRDVAEKLGEELERVLDSVLEENEELEKLQEIRTVIEWYGEAKRDLGKIPSIMSNAIIEKMLEHVQPYFADTLLENISIQLEVRKHEAKIESMDFSLKPIRPYVELAKYINGVEMPPPIRLTFQIDTEISLEGLEISSDPAGKSIELEKLGIALKLSIMKLTFISLQNPIKLGEREFAVNKLSFHLPH